MIINIPIALTLLRLVLLPILIIVFWLPYTWAPFVAGFLFLTAAFTDVMDGYLARALNQSTRFGEFLDPVVDKITVISTLVLLVAYYHDIWMTLPAIFMIAREVLVSALREWMAELGKRQSVAVSMIGKIKTTFQMVAIALLLWHPNEWVVDLGYFGIYCSMCLSLISLSSYIKAAWHDVVAH